MRLVPAPNDDLVASGIEAAGAAAVGVVRQLFPPRRKNYHKTTNTRGEMQLPTADMINQHATVLIDSDWPIKYHRLLDKKFRTLHRL